MNYNVYMLLPTRNQEAQNTLAPEHLEIRFQFHLQYEVKTMRDMTI